MLELEPFPLYAQNSFFACKRHLEYHPRTLNEDRMMLRKVLTSHFSQLARQPNICKLQMDSVFALQRAFQVGGQLTWDVPFLLANHKGISWRAVVPWKRGTVVKPTHQPWGLPADDIRMKSGYNVWRCTEWEGLQIPHEAASLTSAPKSSRQGLPSQAQSCRDLQNGQ